MQNDSNQQLFFVGTYTGEGPYVPTAHGEGIYACNLNTQTGKVDKWSVCKQVPNASYLARSSEKEFLFSVDDRFDDIGSVKAMTYDIHGNMKILSSQSSEGTSTCHLTCDSKGENIFVISYLNGILTRHRFDGDKFTGEAECIHYEGSGPNPERQEQAHVHQAAISSDGNWLYVCDLGSDKIWIHDISIAETLNINGSIDIPPGYGPRHLVWHPALPKAYLFCELNAHVLTMNWNKENGALDLVEDHDSLPEDFNGVPAGSAIRMHPSGKGLYVSNRNHDSFTFFSIDENGSLSFETCFPTGGKTPRDFGIDPTGKWLLAANQDSDTIIPYRLDPSTGAPTGDSAEVFECGTPVCILF